MHVKTALNVNIKRTKLFSSPFPIRQMQAQATDEWMECLSIPIPLPAAAPVWWAQWMTLIWIAKLFFFCMPSDYCCSLAVCVLALESPRMRLLLYHTVHTDSSENHQASTNKDVPRQFHITMLFCRCWGRESKRRRRSRRSLIVELTLYGYIFTFVTMGCLTCLSFWRFSSGYWKIASQAEEQRVMWFK